MPLATLTIRRATARDASALADLAARTFAETFGDGSGADDMALHLSGTYGAERQGDEIADPDVDVLLAEVGSSLAGFAQLRTGEAPSGVAAGAHELWRFYVDRPWHGQGIAPSLMDAVLDAARARGATALWLSVWEHNGRAQSFYAKCGFFKAGTKPFVVGTDIQTDWVMVRPIAS